MVQLKENNLKMGEKLDNNRIKLILHLLSAALRKKVEYRSKLKNQIALRTVHVHFEEYQ